MIEDRTTQLARELDRGEKRFIGYHLIFAIVALAIGIQFGPLQGLEHAGVDWYPSLDFLFKGGYYQGLTLHGVLNALIWTTFFITGFLTLAVIRGLERPLKYPLLNQIGFWMMVVGLVVAAIPILANQATVLYTFYPPLEASALFYIGLVLVVVGSWIEGYGLFFTFYAWRKENPRTRSPLVAMASVLTMALWQFATLGIATEILAIILPSVFGLTSGTDPQLSRTLFWFTGHPLVYFWVLPAYLSWYAMLPKQVGGKLFSDTAARLSFWLFLVLSVPLGFHHQFVDPGVPSGWKFLHAALTLAVVFPSMLTLFTVVASLEHGALKRGGKGLITWVTALPWSKPSVVWQLLGGILFIFGGIGGTINASYNVNLALHNTAWVPGHFHLTVASAVTMTFAGICFWLVPYLTGKPVWQPKVAAIGAWIYFAGMLIFSSSMHIIGLLGAPRRTPLGSAPYIPEEWSGHLWRVGVGGVLMWIGLMIFIVIIAVSAFRRARFAEGEGVEVPIAESLIDPQKTPVWLDRWRPWLIAMVVIVLLAYGPQLYEQIFNLQLTSPGVTP